MEKLFGELENAQKALSALDGDLGNVQFDPDQPASIQAAITQIESMIDERVSRYKRNPLVKELIQAVKSDWADQIKKDAAAKRAVDNKVQNLNMDENQRILSKFENIINDIKWAEYNTFDRHIKKLNSLLHSAPIAEISRDLEQRVDLEDWLKAGYETQGSMVGSATLSWPQNEEEEFGLIISLIKKFSTEERSAEQFCHEFYYKGSNCTQELQFMSAQLLVPFARDFTQYIREKLNINPVVETERFNNPENRKVFVVHGHDEGSKSSMARFLEQMDFEVIILHEQPSQSRTIIENIEHHGDVGFAVVLLTPDDVMQSSENAIYRARQNVIIELGYFIGRLGRSRVSAFKKGNVEVPSDFNGVTYTELDNAGAWKQRLAQELAAAGFKVDFNVVMKNPS